LWELYRGLNGGSYIAMTNRQALPERGAADFSNDFSGEPGIVRRGPVFSEFTVEHALTTNGAFATTARLYAGLRRIEFTTQVMNWEKHVRYHAMVPTSFRATHHV